VSPCRFNPGLATDQSGAFLNADQTETAAPQGTSTATDRVKTTPLSWIDRYNLSSFGHNFTVTLLAWPESILVYGCDIMDNGVKSEVNCPGSA